MSEQDDWLLRPARLWSWAELRGSRTLPPRMPGLYGWYFDALPSAVPVSRCHSIETWTLAYVGIAAGQTVHKRLRNHFTNNAFGSTLRLTLGCLLAPELGLRLRRVGRRGERLTFGEGEKQLSGWMEQHARVVFVEHPSPRALEKRLLEEQDLPLNVDGHDAHSFYATLRELRARQRAEARRSPAPGAIQTDEPAHE